MFVNNDSKNIHDIIILAKLLFRSFFFSERYFDILLENVLILLQQCSSFDFIQVVTVDKRYAKLLVYIIMKEYVLMDVYCVKHLVNRCSILFRFTNNETW